MNAIRYYSCVWLALYFQLSFSLGEFIIHILMLILAPILSHQFRQSCQCKHDSINFNCFLFSQFMVYCVWCILSCLICCCCCPFPLNFIISFACKIISNCNIKCLNIHCSIVYSFFLPFIYLFILFCAVYSTSCSIFFNTLSFKLNLWKKCSIEIK